VGVRVREIRVGRERLRWERGSEVGRVRKKAKESERDRVREETRRCEREKKGRKEGGRWRQSERGKGKTLTER
jgi:hypothetical protein